MANLKRLILHIGTEKTGTTSIQKFLCSNRKKLLDEYSILYPKFGYDSSAQFELVAALHPMCNSGRKAEFAPDLDFDPDKTWDRFCEELEKTSAETCIVSVEHFSSRINSEGVQFIHKKLTEHLKEVDVKILVYLRNQVDMFQSSFSTYIKTGGCQSHRELAGSITGKGFYYNFYNLCRMWVNVFGVGNIIAKNYDEVSSGRGILQDLLAVLGVEGEPNSFDVVVARNKSWNPLFLEFARELNRTKLKHLKHGERYSILSHLADSIDAFSAFDGYGILPVSLGKEIEQKFLKSNQELVALLGMKGVSSFFNPWEEKKPDYNFENIACDLSGILLDVASLGEL